MTLLSQFAETAAPKGDIFAALGIDWRLLILQIIAFLILVALLGKFVYPWLMKSVDERQANIEAATKAAAKAQEAAAKNHEQVAELLALARKEAAEIVDTAKLESSEIVANSEKKARTNAEQIVADAQAQIQKDVANVKKDLYNETLELVGLATEKVVGAKLAKSIDNDLITAAIRESK
ncbi:MAG: atpF [Candidatus Saccharibacteria bacterium]|nr:atpF [Candidatus Saccharibacteria bacterium]